jgi:protein-S-isoprenylcysteine O-methyltransferase Ste14
VAGPSHRATANLLVALQFVALGGVVLAAWVTGPAGWPWVGAAVVVAAMALAVWGARALGPGLTALPIPNERAVLRTDGPFAWSRHPIYAALIVGAAGVVIWSGRWSTLVAWVVLVVVLRVKSGWEEARLRERFPGYDAYAAATPRFLGLRRPTG